MNPNFDMDRLEPIPSPPGHLVREFCHRALPVLTFIAAGVGAAFLWNQRFVGTLLQGEVEPIRANVTALEGGTISALHVQRWQEVTNQQPIATIQVIDADAVGRSVDVLRSELQVLRSRMALDESRNEQSVETLRVRWMEARVALATSRVALGNAERELQRNKQLFNQRILSESQLDSAQTLRDALELEVNERTQLADGIGESLKRLDATVQKDRGETMGVLERSLAAQESEIAHQGTQILRAPMAGIVRTLDTIPGERVASGAIVAEITSPKSKRIVGFIRQPLILEPRPGMVVEIRTRGATRQVGQSRISEVGADLELINSPLRLRGFDNATERGLAFMVPLPPELRVLPGELVDLMVQPSAD